MKIFAHRGWSAGLGENTISAFKKSVDEEVDGVEFDVRYGVDGETVILSHDKTGDSSALTLDEALRYLQTTNLELLIEFKEYSDEFYALVVECLRKYNLVGRATIFAFPKEAKHFPWTDRKDIKMGIIAPYPKDIRKFIEAYSPDMILFGWGNKRERLKFKLAWAVLSLAKTFARYPSVKFSIGVAYGKEDARWLVRQKGLYGITADLPLL